MRIIALFSLFLFAALPASAQTYTFGGVGTRAEGMGGAFVAVADDVSAVYWNPAGIATGATFDFQISTGRESTLFVGAALPVLGASYYRTSQAAGFTTVSVPLDRQNGGSGEVHMGTFTTSNFGATVVQSIVPAVVVGTTVRVVSAGIDGVDLGTTADFDAGAMVSVWNMRFGVTGRNLVAPEFEMEGGSFRMERQVRVGAALVPRSLPTGVHGPFSIALDADLTRTPGPDGELRRAAAGGEYWLLKGWVGVRGGIRWSTLGASYTAFSGGFTVRLPRSVHVDGQLTNGEALEQAEWNVGARITF
jgi:hypothetical protein